MKRDYIIIRESYASFFIPACCARAASGHAAAAPPSAKMNVRRFIRSPRRRGRAALISNEISRARSLREAQRPAIAPNGHFWAVAGYGTQQRRSISAPPFFRGPARGLL